MFNLEKRDINKLILWFFTLVALSGLLGCSRCFLNSSSLWPLYTARLIRAYLGASNPCRIGSRVTAVNTVTAVLEGDDTSQNWPCEEALKKKGAPLHLVNVTVNETVDSGSGLQHNDQRGIGMAIGPAGISAGIRHHLVFDTEGDQVRVFPKDLQSYRMFDYPAVKRTDDLAPYRGERLTLGQWVGISGAAFSTGMGARTSLAASMLLGFFNVRLGYWWNSGVEPRDRKYPSPQNSSLGKSFANLFASYLFPVQCHLMDEFTARFHGPARKWWNLSDGGHFENMGAYELIRRRLPLIVVVDAEADPDYRFEGLGNLVRKARTDFGAIVKFVDVEKPPDLAHLALGPLKMLRGVQGTETVRGTAESRADRSSSEYQHQAHPPFAQAALARIRYGDGATPDSLLVYLKPTIRGDEPVDIFNYRVANPDFPQQTTADQFFDDAQWESYRQLGWLAADRVFGDTGFAPYHRLRDELSSKR